MYIGCYVAEETPEYTTTRQDMLERHEIIVPEFVQRTFSPQQLGLRALLGLLRAGTSPLSASRSYASRLHIDKPSLRKYSLYLHSPPPPSVSSSSSAPALLGSVGGLAELLPLLLGLL